MELDLTQAVEAAAEAMWADIDKYATENEFGHESIPWAAAPQEEASACRETVRVAIEAAAPILERQVRENVAREIEAQGGLRCPTCGLDAHLRDGPRYWCQNNHLWRGWVRLSADQAATIARGGQP
jgi:hypothetical protein